MDEENIVEDDAELTLGEIEKTMMQVDYSYLFLLTICFPL